MARRLPHKSSEWIDRSNRIKFRFENKEIMAFKGDSITSALIANGEKILGRSFKYHRPRGFVSLANHDANVMLQSEDSTNIRADVTLAKNSQGDLRSINTFGGVRHDLTKILGLFAPVLPVGFYYKAFFKPAFLWPYWEKLIRKLAGLGEVKPSYDKKRYPSQTLFCDILIIGGGAAGTAAAAHFSKSNFKVIMADENFKLGGSSSFDAEEALKDIESNIEQLNTPNITCLTQHFASGYYDDKTVILEGPKGCKQVCAKAIILASGAYEQPAVFRNNDLPCVVLGSSVARLAHRYSIDPFEKSIALVGNNIGFRRLLKLKSIGINIGCILQLSGFETKESTRKQAESMGIEVVNEVIPIEAISKGECLSSFVYRTVNDPSSKVIDCDGLIMSVGWSPASNLLVQAGGKLKYVEEINQLVPDKLPSGVFVAGMIRGIYDLEKRVRDGKQAAEACEAYLEKRNAPNAIQEDYENQSHPYPIYSHPKGNEFVDLDEDLKLKDLVTGMKEGFDSIELLKRYSTIGMGPSQGKISNLNGIRIVADFNNLPVGNIGTVTPRPFVYPVPIGKLAGRRIRRERRTSLDQFHTEKLADIKENGIWRRPMAYGGFASRENIAREYSVVRNAVGIIDVSTLGKIELLGPDARNLLEYAYTCKFDKLKVGMTRYIFMVDAGGTLVDDGVAAKLGEDHFYITATSSHSQTVLRLLELFKMQLQLDVTIWDHTGQVGAINLAGPSSKKVLTDVVDIPLDADSFPYLGYREAEVCGITSRIMRVGFVGELGYEIHMPTNSLIKVWNGLLDVGSSRQIMPFGVEAQRLLRLEKGHLIFGQDTDGNTNPFEVNLGWGVNLKKERFYGRNSLKVLKQNITRKLVGFEMDDLRGLEIKENNLTIDQNTITGRVTSINFSPTLKKIIGLAMIDAPYLEKDSIHIRLDDGSSLEALIVPASFYDPENERQKI
ncbi:MAG: 2Fe-2S iron-sulfur cluster-binding protein [Pseudomonadota bacterium]|nr:2Fe-2S iron-sulfur cluster-binding protein [Pseudomonadota bacterium]